VQKVVVNDLKDDTFYALIWVERDGQMMTIDSRPSDALALALRMDCPIFVEDEVLKNSKISSAYFERTTNEQLRRGLRACPTTTSAVIRCKQPGCLTLTSYRFMFANLPLGFLVGWLLLHDRCLEVRLQDRNFFVTEIRMYWRKMTLSATATTYQPEPIPSAAVPRTARIRVSALSR